MKRFGLVAAAAMTVLMAGCQDYPDTGSVDTRTIREAAEIDEITGKVFGLKETAQAAGQAMLKDENALRWARPRIVEGVAEGKEGPLVSMEYTGVSQDRINAMLKTLEDNARSTKVEILEDLDANIAEAKQGIAEAKAKLATLNKADADFDTAIADEQKAHDDAVKKLQAAQQKVNAIFERAGKEMSAVAERAGFQGLRYSRSLIGNYKVIDYSKGENLPKDCPPQRGHETIDIRDLTNQCAYLHIGTIFLRKEDTERDAREVLSRNFRALAEQAQVVGDDGSDGEKTGLFKTVADAKSKLEAAIASANEQFGNGAERKAQIATLDRKIQDLNEKIAQWSNEEYRLSVVEDMGLEYPEGFHDTRDAYKKSVVDHFMANHMIELAPIVMSPVSDVAEGYFEGVESGYQKIVTVTDVITSFNGSKQVLRSIGEVSLMDPKVAEADSIVVPMNKEYLSMRGRDDSDEKMVEELIEYLEDTYKKA